MRTILSFSEKTKNSGQTKKTASPRNIVNLDNKGELKFFQMSESVDDVACISSGFLKMIARKTERAPIVRYRRIHREKNRELNRVDHEQNAFQMAGR